MHEPALEGEQEIFTIAISALLPGDSPRAEGQDHEHIIRLAEAEGSLPPILVNRYNMQVIDGAHRVFAAILRGEDMIDAIWFDGSEEDAFLRSVRANVTHGLPLSLADRRSAAERIILSHRQMSDRAIARATGLGAKTVAAIRRRQVFPIAQADTRVGIDGKARPLNSAEGRLRAAKVLAEHPHASLRAVARLAGISPATVSDVRKRLAAGELPVGVLPSASEVQTPARPVPDEELPARPRRQRRAVQGKPDLGHALEKLLRDPSLRHKQVGRELLRLLHHNAVAAKEWPELVTAVPRHCRPATADLARQYAESWLSFVEQFEERTRAVE
ncbi:ParB N-terminal domain-containing protein [Streptomyces phaeochromogenes]|uniref:ParB N-terminal domain-containing protein n=1 Tax=Streptomyces phaeochromogenes TaxID=1923 RepID=UPI003717D5BC